MNAISHSLAGRRQNPAFVSTHDVRKTFIMGSTVVRALDGVSVDIPENSFTVIQGPSGSGKSTLLYLLGGLDRPTSGTLNISGQSIESMDENALAVFRREKVGFIFQSFNLVSSMVALENVAFPMRFAGISPRERRERAMTLLTQVGLEKRSHHKPTELSGGQQQRVAVARALVNDPPIILADEPTGNLDTQSGYSIMQLLAQLHSQGRTVIVVTHDPRMAHFATHTIHLLDGKVVTSEEYEHAIALEQMNSLPKEEKKKQ